MKNNLSALFLKLGFITCALSPTLILNTAWAQTEGLPVVESREMYSAEALEQVPVTSDRPMLLLEEESEIHPVSAIPDTPAAKINQLQQQVQELQGKLEMQEHVIQELNKQITQIANSHQDLALKMQQAASAPTVSEQDIQQDKALYHKAYSLAQAKEYDQSIKAFALLIQSYPQSTYVPTAYFWMGEMESIQGKYDEAIQHFNQIVLNYPASPKISEALFKIGYIAYVRGDNKLAIKHFNDLKVKFPGTAAAKQADQYLNKFTSKK